MLVGYMDVTLICTLQIDIGAISRFWCFDQVQLSCYIRVIPLLEHFYCYFVIKLVNHILAIFFVNEHPIATLLLTNKLPFWPIKPSRFGNNTLLPLSTRAQLHFFLLCVFFLGKKEHANYYFCCYDTCGVKKTTKKKLQCGKQLIGIFCFIIATCTKNSLFIVFCCCNACEGAC